MEVAAVQGSEGGGPRGSGGIGGRILASMTGFVRRLFAKEAFSFILHCLLLIALFAIVRPMFAAAVPAKTYGAPVIVWRMILDDIGALAGAARHQRPAVPGLLFLAVPTLLLALGRRKITWDSWEHGRALRGFIMVILGVLVWSGSTFDYNVYLNRGHFVDRLLLVGLGLLSWRTPLAVPLATKWAIVMIKEAYVPIALDDFDFRSLPDILIAFSCFAWMSFRRSFKPHHFLFVALAAWASYYYAAGVAKWKYGPPGSWLNEDPLSNLSYGAYVRGWINILPEPAYLKFLAFVRRFDRFFAWYTMVVELAAILMFHLHPRVVRVAALACFLLNFGIFCLTGICFWKWMTANIALFVFLGRGGAPIVEAMCRHKLALVLAAASIHFSLERTTFFPQTGVAWYDSRLVENYTIHAVGPSGHSYLVHPSSIAPMEMHWVQGRLCYATKERSVTGIYGVTGSHAAMLELEKLKRPEDALALVHKGRPCDNPERRKGFDDFMARYFGNLNRFGRPHRWLRWIGRPTHLWVQPRGDLYDLQEPVVRIELWREVTVLHGDVIHRLEKKKVHEVTIPQAGR